MRATAGSIGSRGKHCLDEQKNKLLLEHFMGGSINPLGIENQLVLTYCTPFIEKPGILFDFTKLEFGLANYISPTHIHVGPTVRFAPLSFLILRAELTGFYIWPIPLQGAGFIMTKGYDDFNKETVSPKLGEATDMSGLRIALGVTLQGALPLGRYVDVLIVNGLTGEFWRVANGAGIHPAHSHHGRFHSVHDKITGAKNRGAERHESAAQKIRPGRQRFGHVHHGGRE